MVHVIELLNNWVIVQGIPSMVTLTSATVVVPSAVVKIVTVVPPSTLPNLGLIAWT